MVVSFRCCAADPWADPRHGVVTLRPQSGCAVALGQSEEQLLEFFERDAPGCDERFYRFALRRRSVFGSRILNRTLGHDRRDGKVAGAPHRRVDGSELGEHVTAICISALDVVDKAVELPARTLEPVHDLLARRHAHPSPVTRTASALSPSHARSV